MMFKQLTALLLLFILIIPGIAVKAEVSDTEWENADILLVYNNDLAQEEIADIQIIIRTLTYLQHSVVFASVDESIPILANYNSIICYGLKGDLDGFTESLLKADKAVMMLGGECVEEYTAQKGYGLSYSRMPNTTANVSFKFSDGKDITALMKFKGKGILLNGNFSYESGRITMQDFSGSLYSRYDNFVYMPFSDLSEPMMEASFTKEVAQWLWPYNGEPHAYGQYIVIDKVFPFIEPEQLMEAVKYLVDNKLPFVISVMPIYQNGGYPAMKRFCEVLRYAQANGGAVIMHAPIIQQDQDDIVQIRKYLTIAMEAYTNFGVYPQGVQVPENFIFQENGREFLKRYSTVFFYPDKEENIIDLGERYNIIFKDGHNIIGPAISVDQMGSSKVKVHSTAVYLDLYDGMDVTKERIKACTQSNISLKNLWDMNNAVYANNLYLYTDRGQVYFNNQKVSLEFQPFQYDDNFDYKNNVFQWITQDLKSLNKMLTIIVIISTVIFSAFIIIARNVNRKRFLYPKVKEGEK